MIKNSIPQIRFQGFDSWWETIKLTDLGISVGGTAIESEFDPDGKYKVISIGSYSEESKYKDQGIRAIYSKKTEKRILEKDDLTMILNDKTSTGKIIGRVLLIDEDNSYVYNQRTQRICLDKNKYVPDFIFQLLNADINRNKIVRSAQGNTQIYVNWSDISNLDYLIPDSFDEQSAIGSLFRTLDDLLASYKDNLANYQSFKATMISKMFPKAGQTVPEIRLDGFEGEWEELQLSDICQKVTEKNKDNKFNETFTNSAEFGIINQRDFFEKDISNEKSLNTYYVVRNNDFVYNPRISNYAPVGPIKRNKLGRTGVMSPLYFVFRIINSNIDLNFLETFFDTNTWHKFMKLNGDSGARADRFAIKDSVFLTMPIAFPSLPEQQAIGSYFSNLDNLITAHQEKISQLETLKKKLLQDMFI